MDYSIESLSQVEEASLKVPQEEEPQSRVDEEPQFEPDKADLQVVREASEDVSSESPSVQHLVSSQSQPEQISGESLTVWNVYCAIKEAVERQKAEDDDILKAALQSQEEKNQMETVKILENCNNTLRSLNVSTERSLFFLPKCSVKKFFTVMNLVTVRSL